jgi:hypothetical protein
MGVGRLVSATMMVFVALLLTVRTRLGMSVIVAVIVRVVMSRVRRGGNVSAALRLERFLRFGHRQVHLTQQVGEHVVGLEFQMVRLQFQGYMAVAEVVRRANEVECRSVAGAGRDDEHRLWRCMHDHERAVLGHEHIATSHHTAAGQKHADVATEGVAGVEAAFLAHVPVELDRRRALQENAAEAASLWNELVDLKHEIGTLAAYGGKEV